MESSIMTISALNTLFGWMTVINISLLVLSVVLLIAFKPYVLKMHSLATGLDSAALEPAYFHYLAVYKLLIIIFNLVPYLALKLL